MADDFDGMTIALARIAEEAERRTGFLDLGGLGLTTLPEQLFALLHLRRLNLGIGIALDDGHYYDARVRAEHDFETNTLSGALEDLRRLPDLIALSVSATDIADLAPLAGLAALQTLQCWATQVSDLAALAGLAALQTLACWNTQVSDLAPLAGLAALRHLDCDNCPLTSLPVAVRNLPNLNALHLHNCRIPGIPAEVLSKNNIDNCLAAVRAHFRDLEAGAAPATDVKLIVLGNGRVGKTQICKRLRGEDYDSSEPSTHGILVTSAPLSLGDAEPIRLNLWDFGGQDLYHGTHALFMRTSAIFLSVWAKETEGADTHEHNGFVFQNRRLPYWLAYIKHLGAADSPVLVVQTRCDRAQDAAVAPPMDPVADRPSAFTVPLAYSALNNRGRDSLDAGLRDAVAYLREKQGIADIGIGRMHVLRAVQDLRDADKDLEPRDKRHRTITQTHFQSLCDQAGHISSPEQLLAYLHHAGVVFYRKGLFQDRIVLDQAWALDAVYTVFNRDKCVRELKRLRGRFTRPLLDLLVWGEHAPDEQRLFLDMMRQCGICFVHRRGPHNDPDATEYIAPDLLPEKKDVELDLAALWDDALPTETDDIPFEMLHPGLVRGLICEIGQLAGTAALYWNGGVALYETETRSHAIIEQDMHDALRGTIRVRTQGGQAAALLDRLCRWIEERSGRDGLKAARAPRRPVPAADRPEPRAADTPPVIVGPSPGAASDWFVSYAWDDPSPDGAKREKEVDRLCETYEARGITIQRDKNVLRYGDSIRQFMQHMGAAEKIFIVMSEKYLSSEWCMTELFEIWDYSRRYETDFLKRVVVWCLPDARISTHLDRVRCAAKWKEQFDEAEALVRQRGTEILRGNGLIRHAAVMNFYQNVYDILDLISGTVRHTTFEDLMRHGLEGE